MKPAHLDRRLSLNLVVETKANEFRSEIRRTLSTVQTSGTRKMDAAIKAKARNLGHQRLRSRRRIRPINHDEASVNVATRSFVVCDNFR